MRAVRSRAAPPPLPRAARRAAAGLPALAACAGLSALAACATTVAGVVYVDRNGDRARQPDEPALPGALVSVDRGAVWARTDRAGAYAFLLPAGAAHIWVRVPAGFRPGPVWLRADADARGDLGVIPLTPEEDASPLTFIVAADTHATTAAERWTGGDLADGIDQATSLAVPPRFFTIVGDVTQANRPEELARVEDALRHIAVPWVPVAGNHDWYDGGRTWRSRWGPDNYSFEVGDLHVIVWDTNLSEDDQLAFFRADLAHVAPGATVVALGHASPTTPIADELAALGVDYLFTGHWHANRRVERTGLVEWGTQTLMMGTIDQSPAGYRIVTFVGGQPSIEHRARLVQPHLAVTAPHPGSCAPPGPLQVLASAALDAATPIVTARVNCGPEVELSPRGGWAFGAQLPALPPGTHRLTLAAAAPSGRRLERDVAFDVCPTGLGAPAAADWPQLGGAPEHRNATPRAIAPPLQQAWATSIGGAVVLGTPVIAAGVVVIASWDLGAGDTGGLVALDLATGAERWRYVTPYPTRSAPAIDVATGTVVAALGNGEVHAVALADGAPRWSRDLADGLDALASSLWAAPTIADGRVFAAVQGRLSALDVATGAPVWTRELTPTYAWLGSLAAVTVADGTAIVNTARQDGTAAWAAATGAPRWLLKAARTVAVSATPVADAGTIYLVNAAGTVSALSQASGAIAWSTSVTPEATDWDYTVTATPALVGGRLIVPTQYRELVALDASSGAELWRYATPGGPLQFAHYRAAEPGFAASSVATGDLLWVPRPDGVLAALAVADGRELWATQLGAPLVSAPAPAGDYLVVATFDGTVRALVPAAAGQVRAPAPPATACASPPVPPGGEAGCCRASPGAAGPLALAALVGVVLHFGRRRRAPGLRRAWPRRLGTG
jgi:outer membrane protein assembly factor BamB